MILPNLVSIIIAGGFSPIIAGGFSPILAVITTSIVSSSLSSAVNLIAAPANNYGVNAGLNSVAPSGGNTTKTNVVRGGDK